MKKSLILSAALFAAFGANAEVFTYDFNENPLFCKAIYAEAGTIVDEASEMEGLGFGATANYDFIDKTGMAKNTDGSMFNVKDDEGVWHAVKNRAISLFDGQTYTLEGTDGDFTPIDKNYPFICWNQEGVGPARVLCMGGWGQLEMDLEAKADYNAIDADNWVATRNAIAFNRNANTGSRTGTYVQFPVVVDPASITIYIGHAGGKYIDKGLYAEVVPVVNGVEGEMIPVQGPEDAVAKRYYKMNVALPEGLKGNVAFRVGCGGSELGLYHVVIEGTAPNSAIEGIIADEANENAPIYNVMGIQVDENYKGLVIKNGKKYIQR